MKALADQVVKTKNAGKEIIKREQAEFDRITNDRNNTDQSIVESLYSLEVKLKVGQMRAKNWQDHNRKEKAQFYN